MSVLLTLELSRNDAEALLRHAQEYQPDTGDHRETARLREALAALADAIRQDMGAMVDTA